MYSLLKNPSYLTRIIAEVDSLPSGISNNDLVNHVPLLEATISENLRLHTPVPVEALQSIAQEDLAMPDGTIVPPGGIVMWSPWVMARLPVTWGEDAGSFRPERWMEMKYRPSAFENPVFHAGKRNCLGQQLAKLELVVVMKELLQNYEFEMGWDGSDRSPRRGFTARMEGGLPIKVRRREQMEKSGGASIL